MTRNQLIDKISSLKNEMHDTINNIKSPPEMIDPNKSILMDAYCKLLVAEDLVHQTSEWE